MRSLTVVRYYEFGEYRIDVKNRQLYKNNESIPLIDKSFKVLQFLVENRGIVISKNELIKQFWQENYLEKGIVVQHIYRIRKSIGDGKDGVNYIKTIPKHGYKFVGDVKEIIKDLENDETLKINHNYQTNLDKQKETKSKEPPIYLQNSKTDFVIEDTKTTKKSKSLLLTTSFLLIALFASLMYFSVHLYNSKTQSSEIKSIAILPFNQIGWGEKQELGLGMADTLIVNLSKQQQISILPTKAIIGFLGNKKGNPLDIGKKLNVDAVIIGTIQRDGELVRVNIQYLNINEGTYLWSENFDSRFSDIFSLQDNISEHVAQKLSIKTDINKESLPHLKYTKNFEAYQSYLTGLMFWNKRTPKDLKQAVKYFNIAREKDPNFVLSHAYLADTHLLIGLNKFDSNPNENLLKAKDAAKKAIKLDSESSEAKTALGLIALYEEDLDKAYSLFNEAVKFSPNNANANHRLSFILAYNGNLDEAINQIKIAQKLNPLSYPINTSAVNYLMFANRTDEALNHFQKLINFTTPSEELKLTLSEIYEQKKDYSTSIEVLESIIKENPKSNRTLLMLVRIYLKTNKPQKAQELLSQVDINNIANESKYSLATVYVELKKYKEAVKILREIDFTHTYLLFLQNDYNLDEMRDYSEFNKFMVDLNNKLRGKKERSG